ncbi:MAG: hypothetical protein AAF288_08865 [Planctomycetota bacterium]
MLKLATLLDNPGEPALDSQYRDPKVLLDLGYNGLVLYESTAVSGVAAPDDVADPEMQRWVAARFDRLSERITKAAEAGLKPYLSYDALVLPRERAAALGPNPDLLADDAVCASVDALTGMLERWPELAGVVLRLGDNDAKRLPYLVAGDVYRTPPGQPHGQLATAERAARLIDAFYKRVVDRAGKTLIVRAWNVRPGGFHDAPDLAADIARQLPGPEDDPNLVLSFKFTQTDFWRWQAWNPASLAVGKRPVIYELQCAREFEGKGGFPNWQAPLWRDGPPECAPRQTPPGEPEPFAGGLRQASERINYAGVFAWVRGGGWGGPFVTDERWIDANVYAAPRLADDPDIPLQDLAEGWVRDRLAPVRSGVAKAMQRVLFDSVELSRQLFYVGPWAQQRDEPWNPAGDWLRDDLVDAESLRHLLDGLSEEALAAAVREKESAAAAASRLRAELQTAVRDRRDDPLEPLVNSLLSLECFAQALRDLVAGVAANRRQGPNHVTPKLLAAQSHWNHYAQRFAALQGVATPFRERRFWELTQGLLDQNQQA